MQLRTKAELAFSNGTNVCVNPLKLRGSNLVCANSDNFIASHFNRDAAIANDNQLRLSNNTLSTLFNNDKRTVIGSSKRAVNNFNAVTLTLAGQNRLLTSHGNLADNPKRLALRASTRVGRKAVITHGNNALQLLNAALARSSLKLIQTRRSSTIILRNVTTVINNELTAANGNIVFPGASSTQLRDLTLTSNDGLAIPYSHVLELINAVSGLNQVAVSGGNYKPGFTALHNRNNTTIVNGNRVHLLTGNPKAGAALRKTNKALSLNNDRVLANANHVGNIIHTSKVIVPSRAFTPLKPVKHLAIGNNDALALKPATQFIISVNSTTDFSQVSNGNIIRITNAVTVGLISNCIPPPNADFSLVAKDAINNGVRHIRLPPTLTTCSIHVRFPNSHVHLALMPPRCTSNFRPR